MSTITSKHPVLRTPYVLPSIRPLHVIEKEIPSSGMGKGPNAACHREINYDNPERTDDIDTWLRYGSNRSRQVSREKRQADIHVRSTE